MSAIRPMTAMEEQRLARRIADRDGAARDRLAMAYLPLAKVLSRRYAGRLHDRSDLVSEAAIALLQAAAQFRPDAGRFRPRAVRAILRAFWRLAQRERRERARRGEMPRSVAAPPTSDHAERVERLRAAVESDLSGPERRALRRQYGIGVAAADDPTPAERERRVRAHRKIRAAFNGEDTP